MLTEEQKRARADTLRRNDALRDEQDARRREAKRREGREKGMYLTRDQAAAGEPCRGCGLLVIDGLGSWPPLMHLSDLERIDYDVAEAKYKERHPDCRAHRWSMEGSRTTHCGLCCPPLPLSQNQIESISGILNGHVRRGEELDVWALDLTCGHRTERSVHYTQRYWIGTTTLCPECELTRGIVGAERIVEAASRMAEVKQKRTSDVARAEKEVARAEKAATEAREKLAALRAGQ